jgi:hypothetical protein
MATESERVRILRENELLKAENERLKTLGKDTIRHLYRNGPMEGSRDSFMIQNWEAALADPPRTGEGDADDSTK